MSKHKTTLAAAIVSALGGQELCNCTGCQCTFDQAHAEKLVEAIAPVIQQIVEEDVKAAAEHHVSVGAEVAADLNA